VFYTVTDFALSAKQFHEMSVTLNVFQNRVIEKETEKDVQKEGETINAGDASDVILVFTGSDSSSEQQVDSSSPSYDLDVDGTQRNEAVWDIEDDHISPSSDTEILATVQHSYAHDNVNIFENMFVHDQTHPEHSESISDTYVVEQNDSNITFATPDMDPNRNKPAQDGSSYEQDRALFASLINNFKHELDKCNNDNREAKQANVLLTKELERFKEMEKGFQNVTKRKAELEFENSNLKSQARKFEMNGESVKPILKRNEELEVGYREAILREKRSIQNLDAQMVINNRKVQALVKENSVLKSENSRLKTTTSNYESVNTKLENENQEFLKRTNDLENKLRKLGQTSQTINMLPTKDEEVSKQTSGIGFENSAQLENGKPCFLNKVKKLTPILYNAGDMGKELSDDLLFESQDILKSEEEKRLKVKQTKNPLSYHGFVYGCTQLTDFPKAPFKRKDTNVKRFFKEAQLATYDATLWQNKVMRRKMIRF
jgi:hypothetical protein